MNGCAIKISSYVPDGLRQEDRTPASVDSILDREGRPVAPTLLSTLPVFACPNAPSELRGSHHCSLQIYPITQTTVNRTVSQSTPRCRNCAASNAGSPAVPFSPLLICGLGSSLGVRE